MINADTRQAVANIKGVSQVHGVQAIPSLERVYVTATGKNEVAVLDERDLRVTTVIPAGSSSKERLAFVACEGNAKLLAVDMRTMRVLAAYSIGEEPDVLAFDLGLHVLYAASENGVVSVFRENKQSLEKPGEGFLAKGAHTVAVDAQTHRVYFPLPDVHGRPTLRVMSPTIAMYR